MKEELIKFLELKFGITLEMWRDEIYESFPESDGTESWEYGLYNQQGENTQKEIVRSPSKDMAFLQGVKEILNTFL